MKLKRSKIGQFVPVKKETGIYYGGNQEDLKYMGVSKFLRDRSCVVTAFTNTYLYMYRPEESFSLDKYNDYQYLFFKILKPKVYGIPSAKVLNLKVNKLRKFYKIDLKAHFLEESLLFHKTIKQKADFIKEGLEKDCPVIFFNWSSSSVKVMKHHGVVITEIEENENDPSDYIISFSSWGKKYQLSLKEFSKQCRTYTGFVYFERMDK